MTIYTVKLTDGSNFRMSADMVQASAPISADFHGEDEWQGTPYQTANARHDAEQAAKLVNDYFCACGDDSQVESVERTGGDNDDQA